MHLIIGGAYQGKTEYAKAHFALKDEDIFTCTENREPDFSAPCVRHLEEYALLCLRRGQEPLSCLLEKENEWKHCIFLCNDISCGVVPIEQELRLWREAVGRMVCWLSTHAESVTRLFCGLPQVLK